MRVYEGMPNYLSTAQELASMNLEPLDEAVRCYKKGLRWVLLYDPWLTAIAGSNLLPTYTWNNRPQDLKTLKQLYKYNRIPGDTPHGCIEYPERLIFLYRWEEYSVDDKYLLPHAG